MSKGSSVRTQVWTQTRRNLIFDLRERVSSFRLTGLAVRDLVAHQLQDRISDLVIGQVAGPAAGQIWGIACAASRSHPYVRRF